MISREIPRSTVYMPIVAMKSGIRPLVMMMPLVAPASIPTRRAIGSPAKADRADGQSGYVELLGHQHSGKDAPSAATAPTDRSIPPEMITSVWPIARMAVIEVCLETLTMLLRVRKCGVAVDR